MVQHASVSRTQKPPVPACASAHAHIYLSLACHARGRLSLQGGAQAIKARGLDAFYNLEEDMLSGKADTAAMLRLIQVPDINLLLVSRSAALFSSSSGLPERAVAFQSHMSMHSVLHQRAGCVMLLACLPSRACSMRVCLPPPLHHGHADRRPRRACASHMHQHALP